MKRNDLCLQLPKPLETAPGKIPPEEASGPATSAMQMDARTALQARRAAGEVLEAARLGRSLCHRLGLRFSTS